MMVLLYCCVYFLYVTSVGCFSFSSCIKTMEKLKLAANFLQVSQLVYLNTIVKNMKYVLKRYCTHHSGLQWHRYIQAHKDNA